MSLHFFKQFEEASAKLAQEQNTPTAQQPADSTERSSEKAKSEKEEEEEEDHHQQQQQHRSQEIYSDLVKEAEFSDGDLVNTTWRSEFFFSSLRE